MTDAAALNQAMPGLERQLEDHRAELAGFCYRMLGSPFEAEDAVQETLLCAWRALDRFEGRAALRSWLFGIATNVCIDMLNAGRRRALPMDLASPSPAVPVTADLLDGYGLDATELVDRLLRAGAVGCNIEDSDHARPGRLLDPAVAAARIAAVRSAALRSGVDVVVNARIDTYLHDVGADPASMWSDIVRRARAYIDASADCVYPIRLTDPERVAELATELNAPVNANLAPDVRVRDLAEAGAARISVGPMAHRIALTALDDFASELLAHRPT